MSWKFIKKQIESKIRSLPSDLLQHGLSWLWPPIAAALTVPLGYIQNLPWMYIWVGTGTMFAMTTHGISRFYELRERSGVDGKINALNAIAGKEMRGEGLNIGIVLHNSASFPVECECVQLRTSLGNTIPSNALEGVMHLV